MPCFVRRSISVGPEATIVTDRRRPVSTDSPRQPLKTVRITSTLELSRMSVISAVGVYLAMGTTHADV